MNARQLAFYRQAVSDWSVFRHLRQPRAVWFKKFRRLWCKVVGVQLVDFPSCHALHYLQMCTEKLAKAYYQTDLRSSHAAFRRFLTDLPSNAGAIAPLGFPDLARLTLWQGSVMPLVGAIEDLAPSRADALGLPNPEYPWPRNAPVHAPMDHSFQAEIFSLLDAQATGGQPPFLEVLQRMVETMQTHAWHL